MTTMSKPEWWPAQQKDQVLLDAVESLLHEEVLDAAVRLDNLFKEALPHATKMKPRRQAIVKLLMKF